MANRNCGGVRSLLPCVLVFAALAGCQENAPGYGPITASTGIQKPELDLSANSGVPVAPAGALNAPDLAASRSLGSRGTSAFALLGEERQFDLSQRTESVISSVGGFALEITPVFDDAGDDRPVIEPVPNWRLSGVLIGRGVMALLDTGSVTYEIRPGMTVPNTEWRVVAIDSDRALLARDGNKLPKEFWVGLSGPITGPGVAVAGGQGGGNTGGGNTGVGVPGNRGGGGRAG